MNKPKHPLDLKASEIAAGVRGGEFSAVAVVEESLRRAHAVQDELNAFTLIRDDQAMKAAHALDAAISSGRSVGALAGVPFAAKDLTPTRGDLTTLGSWSSGDWVPEETALCIRRLEQEGAILIGKTTTPEFAYASFTQSPRFGVTLNPVDSKRTPGGSSGGSAVVVKRGVVPFAEGTDMGGSVRIPAALSGVVGLKPSLGRIPMTILPSVFDNISHFGPLARTVSDAVAFMAVASGPSDEDIQSLPLHFSAEQAAPTTLKGRRFAFSLDLGYYRIQPEVEQVVRTAVKCLREAGAIVDEIDIGWSRAVNDQWFDLWCVFMSAFFGERLGAHRERMDPAVVDMIERGLAFGATDYKRVEILRTSMWKDMSGLLRTHEALLCPTCAVLAPLATENDDAYVATTADGRYAGLDMTCPFNMLPQLPALSIPAGVSAQGLPVGLQIIGRRFADEAVLAIGGAMEGLFP